MYILQQNSFTKKTGLTKIVYEINKLRHVVIMLYFVDFYALRQGSSYITLVYNKMKALVIEIHRLCISIYHLFFLQKQLK